MIRFGLLIAGVFCFFWGTDDVDKITASVYIVGFWVVTALRRAT